MAIASRVLVVLDIASRVKATVLSVIAIRTVVVYNGMDVVVTALRRCMAHSGCCWTSWFHSRRRRGCRCRISRSHSRRHASRHHGRMHHRMSSVRRHEWRALALIRIVAMSKTRDVPLSIRCICHWLSWSCRSHWSRVRLADRILTKRRHMMLRK